MSSLPRWLSEGGLEKPLEGTALPLKSPGEERGSLLSTTCGQWLPSGNPGPLPTGPSSQRPVYPHLSPEHQTLKSSRHLSTVSPGIKSQPQTWPQAQGMDGDPPSLGLKLGTSVSHAPYQAQHQVQSSQACPLLCPMLPAAQAITVWGPSWSPCLSGLSPHPSSRWGRGQMVFPKLQGVT